MYLLFCPALLSWSALHDLCSLTVFVFHLVFPKSGHVVSSQERSTNTQDLTKGQSHMLALHIGVCSGFGLVLDSLLETSVRAPSLVMLGYNSQLE